MNFLIKCSCIYDTVIGVWLVVIALMTTVDVVAEFNALEENIFYHISWPGPMSDFVSLQKTSSDSYNSIVMTTANDEKFKCILPSTDNSDEDADQEYQGPSAFELISPLFTKFTCILRFEQYWVYELCHGRHLRQYHEEKEPGKPEVKQEYYLGKYDMNDFTETARDFKQGRLQRLKVLHRSVEGIIMPYVAINMTDGTRCDLSGRPRMTSVQYACHPSLKQEIYSIEETLTCEYEVLVLTDLLCDHPDYRPKSPITNEIHCHSLDSVGRQKPIVLQNLETESLILNPSSPLHSIKMQFDTLKETKTNYVDVEIDETKPKPPPPQTSTSRSNVLPEDNRVVQEFLEGRHCLHGGSGWWKYEFCHGKKVEQYHEVSGRRKTVLVLGTWDKATHLEWLQKNPHKRPKSGERRHVSHFYGDGDFCTEAATTRRIEVKLRCKDSMAHPSAVSLYLLEPRICEYILVVESSILCSLLPNADENGLFRHI